MEHGRPEPREIEFPTTQNEVSQHIEWIIRNCTDSINDRTFTSAPAWKYVDPHFIGSFDAGPRPSSQTKDGLVEAFKAACAEYPRFRLEVEFCSGAVDMERGYAEMYTHSTETGGTEDSVGRISKKLVTVFTFNREESGRWMAKSETSVFGPGMG